MTWGSTAYTPIISYNSPPFGFEERANPPDFNVCPEDPYAATENLKNQIKHMSRINNNKNGEVQEFFSENEETTGSVINLFFIVFLLFALAYFLLIR